MAMVVMSPVGPLATTTQGKTKTLPPDAPGSWVLSELPLTLSGLDMWVDPLVWWKSESTKEPLGDCSWSTQRG